ncbi:response regulator transcription factor [SAR202 cluster bacterium AD-802-E10_MRT_200m]|nr:response regulator transcription factor [SAR202 cluster bacterium AD-802-E10_MRT_200m]
MTEAESPDLLLLDAFSISDEELLAVLAFSKDKCYPTLAVLDEPILNMDNVKLSVSDFVLFPFSNLEIVTRIRKLLHAKLLPPSYSREVIYVDGLKIDQRKYDVLLDGNKIFLTYKEYELLRLLASSPGQVFSREELLSKVWGYDYFGGTRTVDVHIRRLRGKVEHPARTFIETIWNVGYRFKERTDI